MGFDFCHSRPLRQSFSEASESGNPVCFKDFSGFPINPTLKYCRNFHTLLECGVKSGMTLESYSYH